MHEMHENEEKRRFRSHTNKLELGSQNLVGKRDFCEKKGFGSREKREGLKCLSGK